MNSKFLNLILLFSLCPGHAFAQGIFTLAQHELDTFFDRDLSKEFHKHSSDVEFIPSETEKQFILTVKVSAGDKAIPWKIRIKNHMVTISGQYEKVQKFEQNGVTSTSRFSSYITESFGLPSYVEIKNMKRKEIDKNKFQLIFNKKKGGAAQPSGPSHRHHQKKSKPFNDEDHLVPIGPIGEPI